MDMRELERTEELLHKGLKEINDKGDYNNVSLDIIGKTVDTLKDICEIKDDSNKSYGRHGGEWTAEGTYGRMFPMYGAGQRGMDGDGDGRYYEGSRYHGYGNSGESYSGNYGNRGGYGRMYGHGNEDMVERLRRDMQNAQSEQERDYIRRLLRQYE